MADAPAAHPPEHRPVKAKGGPLSVLTQKAGPLPVWAYAVIALGAYLLYRHFAGSSSTATAPTTTTDQSPVGLDNSAGAGGGGGIGDTTVPDALTATDQPTNLAPDPTLVDPVTGVQLPVPQWSSIVPTATQLQQVGSYGTPTSSDFSLVSHVAQTGSLPTSEQGAKPTKGAY